ncbi:hypothetical protein E3N88_43221 [Mikania micrantha]|uniref:Uncharacterized protein n=1 Tax=Mikania micrantha TaxID=192012 RepID=A0A5N6LHS2_9ASTR|nr:hypothetical protein E3N88_43221 [Mikania micrantha]
MKKKGGENVFINHPRLQLYDRHYYDIHHNDSGGGSVDVRAVREMRRPVGFTEMKGGLKAICEMGDGYEGMMDLAKGDDESGQWGRCGAIAAD